MVNEDAISLLTSLFTHSHIELTIPEDVQEGQSKADSSSRDVAFYDETLKAQLKLYIPTSSALPPPQRGHATYSLPISLDEAEDDPLEERTEQARAARLTLLVLLTCLNIDLRGSYVTPRPSLPPGSNVVPPTTAATPNTTSNVPHYQRPIPSIHPRDAAYAQPGHQDDEVPFYSTTWSGNKQPSQPPPRNTASERIQAKKQEQLTSSTQSDDAQAFATSFVTWDQVEEKWLVTWSISVPVIYARHRHPRPTLLVTTSLALRLSPSSSLLFALAASLSGGSPFLALLHPEASPSWSDHDLLTTLSAGPVYPDESPSQRAARAASALAKLPLSRLPSKVLGSRLVTPERSARDIGGKLASHMAPPSMSDDEDDGDDDDDSSAYGSRSGEGDVTDNMSGSSNPSTRPSSVSSRSSAGMSNSRNRDLSENGLVVHAKSLKSGSASDLKKGEAVVTLHRSARCAMDVRSAIGVKMRTTIIENIKLRKVQGNQSSQDSDPYQVDGEQDTYNEAESDDQACGRALVLCVEVDNPPDSGLLFDVESCHLDITVPNTSIPAKSVNDTSRYRAKANLMPSVSSSGAHFRLSQGEQRNLLYFVHFEITPEYSVLWPSTNYDPATQETNRNVAIVVHGKPLLLQQESDGDPRMVTPDFSSTWNCTLDMQSLDKDLRRKMASSQPIADVLENAVSAMAVSDASHLKNSMGAVAVGGSLKHSASALAAAVQLDNENQRLRHQQQQQQRQQQQGQLGLPRVNTGLSLSSPLSRSPSGYLPSPSQSADQAVLPNGDFVRSPLSQSHRPSTPQQSDRIPSLGMGLLAQARVRAASARIASGMSEGTTVETDHSLTPRFGNGRFASLQSDRGDGSRRIVSTSSFRGIGGPRSRAGSQLPTQDRDPSMSYNSRDRIVSQNKTIVPLAFDSSASNNDYLEGMLVNLRVMSDEHDLAETQDSQADNASLVVPQLSILHVEVLLSNRGSQAKSFVLSWASSRTDYDPTPSGPQMTRSGSLASISSFNAGTPLKPRLMDASAIHHSNLTSLSHLRHSALLPLEEYISTGLIHPGYSTRVYMPLQALSTGTHVLDDLVVYDEESGVEKMLKFQSTGAGGARAVGNVPASSACIVDVVARRS
ncbi:unnamed protein product [Sympodiomycopsis kandeliae]